MFENFKSGSIQYFSINGQTLLDATALTYATDGRLNVNDIPDQYKAMIHIDGAPMLFISADILTNGQMPIVQSAPQQPSAPSQAANRPVQAEAREQKPAMPKPQPQPNVQTNAAAQPAPAKQVQPEVQAQPEVQPAEPSEEEQRKYARERMKERIIRYLNFPTLTSKWLKQPEKRREHIKMMDALNDEEVVEVLAKNPKMYDTRQKIAYEEIFQDLFGTTSDQLPMETTNEVEKILDAQGWRFVTTAKFSAPFGRGKGWVKGR